MANKYPVNYTEQVYHGDTLVGQIVYHGGVRAWEAQPSIGECGAECIESRREARDVTLEYYLCNKHTCWDE